MHSSFHLWCINFSSQRAVQGGLPGEKVVEKETSLTETWLRQKGTEKTDRPTFSVSNNDDSTLGRVNTGPRFFSKVPVLMLPWIFNICHTNKRQFESNSFQHVIPALTTDKRVSKTECYMQIMKHMKRRIRNLSLNQEKQSLPGYSVVHFLLSLHGL